MTRGGDFIEPCVYIYVHHVCKIRAERVKKWISSILRMLMVVNFNNCDIIQKLFYKQVSTIWEYSEVC